MISIESTAKSVKAAIEDGLKKLDKTIDEVEIEIITQPGIFRKAKVKITVEGATPPPPLVKPAASKPITVSTPPKNDRPKNDKPTGAFSDRPNKQSDKLHQNQNGRQNAAPIKSSQNNGRSEVTGHTKPQQDSLPKNERHNRHENKPVHQNGRQNPAQTKFQSSKTDSQFSPPKEKEYKEITDEAAKTASNFAEKLVKSIDSEAAILSRIDGGGLAVKINSNNGAVIGYKGETLDAIEYLTMLSVNRGDDFYKISVDCNEYRIKRQEMLVSKAKHLADKAIKTGRKIIMEPMSSNARKIIHSALQGNDAVFTKSEGNDPHRHVVIVPKRGRN